MYRKLFLIIIPAILIFSSCAVMNNNSSDEPSKTPAQISKETLSKIIVCFENGDKAELKSMMSDYIIENDSKLDDEIDAAFEFIDGKIISYNEPFGDAMGSHEKKACGGSTTQIITEQGTEYAISFSGWLTYDKDESRIGVEGIRVVNWTKRVEYPPDAKEEESPDCRVKIGHFE